MLSRFRNIVAALSLGGLTAASGTAQQVDRKSEGTALGLSLAGTLAPIALDLGLGSGALAALGVMVGPSLGHFYAGNGRRGALGILGRTGVVAGVTIAAEVACSAESAPEYCTDSDAGSGPGILIGTAVAVLVWSILDVVHAPRSARRYNAAHSSVAIDWRPEGSEPTRLPAPGCVALCVR